MTVTERRTTPKAEYVADVVSQIQNASLLHPGVTSASLAATVRDQIEPDIAAALAEQLLAGFILKQTRRELAKQARAKRTQLLLPGFEHVPRRIEIADKQRQPLSTATTWDVQKYVWLLARRYKDRAKQSAKLIEAKALLKLMRKYKRENRRITVGEVFQREAEKR